MIEAIQQANALATPDKGKGKDDKKSKPSARQGQQLAPSYLLHQIDKLPSRYDLRATGHLSPRWKMKVDRLPARPRRWSA